MSVTRTSLCTVKYCPAPSDPDWHRCFVCQDNTIEHHHVNPRGMGGSKKRRDDPLNVIALCHPHHEMVTRHECSDDILEINGTLTYIYLDLHGKTLVERPLREESDGQETGRTIGRTADTDGRDRLRDISDNRPSLTHEQRVAITRQIRDMEWNRQWLAGDKANEWEAELGEEAWQYISEFGYQPETMSNIMRVCEAIPTNIRRLFSLRFSHHVVVAGLNREDMEMWLDKCVEESWSVAEFRRQVKGERPRVKRWTLGELRGIAAMSMFGDLGIKDFLDWLGEQG